MEGKLPNLLVIGAMKAGTTSLHHYLEQHPDIFMSEVKEINYFTRDTFAKKPLEWYTDQFRTDKRIRGESSQNYTKCHNKYYQGVPERIKAHIPEVKMIYLLRDPIQRYRSHILENAYGEPPHDVAYNIESGHYEKTGLYYYQLSHFLEYFSLDQIHVCTLEDLKKDRLGTMNQIFSFLGLSNVEEEERFEFVKNDSGEKLLPYRFKTHVVYRAMAKVLPAGGKIEQMMASPYVKNQVFKQAEKKYLTDTEVQRLKVLYAEDVAKLRKLTGKSFADWSV